MLFLTLFVVAVSRKMGTGSEGTDSLGQTGAAAVASQGYGIISFENDCWHPEWSQVESTVDGCIDEREFRAWFRFESTENIFKVFEKGLRANGRVIKECLDEELYTTISIISSSQVMHKHRRSSAADKDELCKGRMYSDEDAINAGRKLASWMNKETAEEEMAYETGMGLLKGVKDGTITSLAQVTQWYGRHCGPDWGPTTEVISKVCLKEQKSFGQCAIALSEFMYAKDPLDVVCLLHDVKVTYSNAGCCDEFNDMHYSAGDVIDIYQDRYCIVGWQLWDIGWPTGCYLSWLADTFFALGENPSNAAFEVFGNALGPGQSNNCPTLSIDGLDEGTRGCHEHSDSWNGHWTSYKCNSDLDIHYEPRQFNYNDGHTCRKDHARLDLDEVECDAYAKSITEEVANRAQFPASYPSDACYAVHSGSAENSVTVYWNTGSGDDLSLEDDALVMNVCGGNGFCRITLSTDPEQFVEDGSHDDDGYGVGHMAYNNRQASLTRDGELWKYICDVVYNFDTGNRHSGENGCRQGKYSWHKGGRRRWGGQDLYFCDYRRWEDNRKGQWAGDQEYSDRELSNYANDDNVHSLNDQLLDNANKYLNR